MDLAEESIADPLDPGQRGTGVSIERMRGMNTAAVMGRLNAKIASWLLTEEGRDGLEQIRTSLRLMVNRPITVTHSMCE